LVTKNVAQPNWKTRRFAGRTHLLFSRGGGLVVVGWLVGVPVSARFFLSCSSCSLLLLFSCHHSFVFLTLLFPLPLLLQLPPYATLEQARKMLGLTIKYGLGTMMFM